MRFLACATLAALLCTAPLGAANPKQCTDLAAKIDNDVSSPSGVRVTITAHNHCQEDVDGGAIAFKVRALDSGGGQIASQRGSFGGTIQGGATAETKVFVVCDPERARSVKVDPE